ncbi:MAG TPA: FAD-dependent monooxygenase [Pirellulales bacterium]|nr:FAD-dependent monooxygenase [Pirellulales bacterium]
MLVVGAGPVGLTMAAELVRHGLTCRLIDKAATPTDKSKALVLWSRSMEMLDAIGIAPSFVASGLRGRGVNLYTQGERLLHIALAIDSPYNYALLIPQNVTERLLAEHAGRLGVRVERSLALTEFSADETGVTSQLCSVDGQKEQLRSRWLVGCDGAHSTVRHVLGVPFAGDAEPNDWMLADIHLEGTLPSDEISIFFHTQGVLAFFPIVGGRFRVIADLGLVKNVDRPPDPTLAEVQAMIDQRGPGKLTVRDPVWLAGFRIHERMVAEYRHGRVFLVGDAAHIHSPAGGQGMNTGMQDAWNLAWKLALVHKGRAKDVLLDSYSQERSAIGRAVLRNAGLMTTAATLRNPLAQGLRDGAYKLFGSLEVVQRGLSNALAEVSIHYRHGPITGENGGFWNAATRLWEGGVHAGDRAPDVEFAELATGPRLRLFDLLRGSQHILLLLTDNLSNDDLLAIPDAVESRFPGIVKMHFVLTPQSARDLPHILDSRTAAATILIDSERHMQETYGAGANTLFLIRPDGYVGFRGQPASGAALLAHLEQYLV